MQNKVALPETIILDTRDIVIDLQSTLNGIVEERDVWELITQCLQSLMNSNSPLVQTGIAAINYAYIVKKEFLEDPHLTSVLDAAVNKFEEAFIRKLSELGAILDEEGFPYIYHTHIDGDIVVKLLNPYEEYVAQPMVDTSEYKDLPLWQSGKWDNSWTASAEP